MSENAPINTGGKGLKGFTSKKVFGVPVLYIGLVAVLILAFVAWKLKPAQEPTVESPPETDGDPQLDEVPTFTANNPALVAQSPAGVAVGYTADTNDTWTKRMVELLIGQGTRTDFAQNAIQKYINGEQLSETERKLVDSAIKQGGLPPELPGGVDVAPAEPDGTVHTMPVPNPTPTTPVADAPAKAQGTPPLTHTIKSKNEDSFSELAVLYYGRATSDNIDLLQRDNPQLGPAGPFAIGTRVSVPKKSEPVYVTATSTTRDAVSLAAKNGVSAASILAMNTDVKWPVKAGTKVRVK